MTVRIRGIYATALTELLASVVQASPPIRERFETTFPVDPADAVVSTTDDRQGVGVVGEREQVEQVLDSLCDVAVDVLTWEASLSRGGVYAGEVTETLGSGAVVDVGDGEGFLPYSKSQRRIETGDCLRVQVNEASPPWSDSRPVLDTTVRVQGGLATLVRGRSAGGTGAPDLADLVPTDPPEGWGVDWGRASDDADLDALDDALAAASDRARDVDAAFADAPAPEAAAPHRYWGGVATWWVWFGREARFALDEHRRAVTETMPGHHRIKAATREASAAVDFVEAVCGDGDDAGDQDFPFETVTRQFGPTEGDRVGLVHGKPDGRAFDLGPADVTARSADGSVTLQREMSPGGTYDALGVERRAGDVAVTKIEEGRWWYPTVYRGDDGTKRGTYVNVCTPVEVFPDAVRYVDLHVDVVKHADGTVERVDDDELDEAVGAGDVPDPLAQRAREVASAVENAL
jgi:hypothetical protein